MKRPKIILVIAVSLDGRIARPSWGETHLGSIQDKKLLNKALSDVDATLFGSGTLKAHKSTYLIKERNLLKLNKVSVNQPVSIVAGNTGGAVEELDLNSTSDKLTMDGISYTFPVGEKTTVFFGNGVDGSSLYSTACVYGGPSNTLDDCGNVNAALAPGFGTAAGASYEIGDGWTAAFGYEGQGADADAGLLTDEGTDAYGGQLAYSTDSYGVSATYGIIEADGVNDSTYWAFNGYWIPTDNNSIPSVSIGTEYGDHDTYRKNCFSFHKKPHFICVRMLFL